MAFLAPTFIGTLGTTVAGALGVSGPITAATAGVLGTGTLLAGGGLLVGASKLLKAPELPGLPDVPATPSFEQAQAESREDQLKRIRSRSQTILTSSEGLLTPPATTEKTLLGA